jgi:hypothetical protein
MYTSRSLIATALALVVVTATNISGDPTDLANWPACAVSSVVITQRKSRDIWSNADLT